MPELLSQIRWRPQIGDPSFMGWLTVAAYAATALLCFIAARRCFWGNHLKQDRWRHRMWLGVAVLMVFLCVNKQLDLQSLFTDVGRLLARLGGWYDSRRVAQRWFVLAVGTAGAVTLTVIAWKMRSALLENIVLLVGLTSLVTFIVIRAASFHHVDVLIRSYVLGIRINWLLELGGIALVALGAGYSIFRPRAGQGRRHLQRED